MGPDGQRHIEDGFDPKTPSEILLLERIHQLHRQLWHGFDPMRDRSPVDPNDVGLDLKLQEPPHVTLTLAGQCVVKAENMGLHITAQSHGPTAMWIGHFIDARQLAVLSPNLETSLLSNLYQHGLRKITKRWEALLKGENKP